MTARALRGVDMIRDAAAKPQPAPVPAIPFIVLDGLPRTGLSITEMAKITGHARDRIHKAAKNGEIKADRTGQSWVIPVGEIDTINKWADYGP